MTDPVKVEALVGEVRAALSRGELWSRRPASTYRLQLRAEFGFDDAAAVVPYLHDLGITDVYLSPILPAARGSTHGYDVTAHDRLAPALGGEPAYERLCAALAERGMGQLVDFVPNHMGVGAENAYWMELLENGPSSRFASFFDVDWQPVKTELQHKVLVPVLGAQYGDVLEKGELQLVREGGAFFLTYWDHRFPIAPRSVPMVLRFRLEELRAKLGPDEPGVWELESICTSLEKLAPRYETDAGKVAERAREKEVAKRRLQALCETSAGVRAHLDENVAIFNGTPGEPRSYDPLDRLLDGQAYRLAHWRVAGEEINYRRFFDVNGLAALRMEEDRVFEEAHRLVLSLVCEGKIDGLRIDHPDGLYDPTAYFRKLQAASVAARACSLPGAREASLDDAGRRALEARIAEEMAAGTLPLRPLYVLAEKILATGERMPPSWAIDGTTGYEFLVAASGLFVDGAAERAFTSLYSRFTGRRETYEEVAYQRKKLIMSASMAGEINMFAHRLNQLSETNRRTRDFTLNELTRALVELVALFPVYRTYVSPAGEIVDRDRLYVERTVAVARRRSTVLDASIFAFLRDVLLLRYPETLGERERRDWLEFTLKLQQVTGPVTAKALEDTAFYVYLRLAALNEVGGEPREFGTSPQRFHELNQQRLAAWPGSLSASSTHDTKRSEDVRVRIAALSEIPRDWAATVIGWARLNAGLRATPEGGSPPNAPDRNDEYLLYQTLVGTFPEGALPGTRDWADWIARLQRYMEKAIREGKVHTSWTNPNAEYEQGVRDFTAAVLGSSAFVEDFAPFARRIAAAGRISSLAQTALKLASPGVTDVYQGCELWDLSLVDPDNRRPVDFAGRARSLAELARRAGDGPQARAALARELGRGSDRPAAPDDGRAKLFLLREALRLRRDDPALLLAGSYEPLTVEGTHSAHVVAFARRHEGRALLCVVPRLVLRLLDGAGGRAGDIKWDARVALPPELRREWTDLLAGERHSGASLDAARLFAGFPVAILTAR